MKENKERRSQERTRTVEEITLGYEEKEEKEEEEKELEENKKRKKGKKGRN